MPQTHIKQIWITHYKKPHSLFELESINHVVRDEFRHEQIRCKSEQGLSSRIEHSNGKRLGGAAESYVRASQHKRYD